jgi:y4mF family transcriptional regulator
MEILAQSLQKFIKEKRSQANLTQPELAIKAGVGLRFIREMEQGKSTLRMDKVNQVLLLLGFELGPVPFDRQKYLDATS